MHEVFEATTVSRIQLVPLSTLNSNDSPVWKANNIRVFIVKSAYHLAISLAISPVSPWDERSSSIER
jgi:hypothetical protein